MTEKSINTRQETETKTNKLKKIKKRLNFVFDIAIDANIPEMSLLTCETII